MRMLRFVVWAGIVVVLHGCGTAKLPKVQHVGLCPAGNPVKIAGNNCCLPVGGMCQGGAAPTAGCCPLVPLARFGEEHVFYSLPRAVVTAEVGAQKTTVKPGRCVAFRDLATELGLRPSELVQTARHSVKLQSFVVATQPEPDPEMVFAVELSSRRFQKDSRTIELSEIGALSGAKTSATDTSVDFAINVLKTVASLASKFVAPAASAVFAVAPSDFTAAAGLAKSACSNPSDPRQAFCCGVKDQIDQLRSGRSRLLSGEPPPGGAKDAVEFQAAGLDKLERELLANFKGETAQASGKALCSFTPGPRYRFDSDGATVAATPFRQQPSEPLFYFSPVLGLVKNPEADAACTLPSGLSSASAAGSLGDRLLDTVAVKVVEVPTLPGGAEQSDLLRQRARACGEAVAARLEKELKFASELAKGAVTAAVGCLPNSTFAKSGKCDPQALAKTAATTTCRSALAGVSLDEVVEICAGDSESQKLLRESAGTETVDAWICDALVGAMPRISFTPVKLEIESRDEALAAVVADRQSVLFGQRERSYFYRIPVSGQLDLLVGDEVKHTASKTIPQFGVVTALAGSEAFHSRTASYEVTFFAETGGLQKLVAETSGEDGASVAAFGEALTPLIDAELARRAAGEEEAVDELAELQRQQALLEALVAIRDLEANLGTVPEEEEP